MRGIVSMLYIVDSSQTSIFSYCYSIVECVDRIARELDARVKRETRQGRGMGTEKNRGL